MPKKYSEKNTQMLQRRIEMSKFDPALEYDYEDTPRYWAQREMEQMIIEEERERSARYAE
jgi:hypothetical protein